MLGEISVKIPHSAWQPTLLNSVTFWTSGIYLFIYFISHLKVHSLCLLKDEFSLIIWITQIEVPLSEMLIAPP